MLPSLAMPIQPTQRQSERLPWHAEVAQSMLNLQTY
jgi:hypothetical protein